VGVDKCGESDTTSGIGANPCVGNAFDKLYAHGVTLVFGETTELTGGEQLVAARCRTPEVRDKFMFMFNRYQEVIDSHKTSDLMDSSRPRATSPAASPPSRRRRSATSEDRKEMHGGRRARQGRGPSGPACGSWIPPRPRRKW